jgi:hypothetical protein
LYVEVDAREKLDAAATCGIITEYVFEINVGGGGFDPGRPEGGGIFN